MATFNGNANGNTFGGTVEDDLASGNGGNDILVGGPGEDELRGGAGDDILFSHDRDFDFPEPFLYPGISYDVFAEPDILLGGTGDDYIFAGYGDTVDGGTYNWFGDRLFISFLGSPTGVEADFRPLQTGGTVTIGGATIRNIQDIGYLEGSEFDDLLVPIDTFYPSGAPVYGRGGNDHIIADYYSGFTGQGLYGGDGDDIVDGRTAQYGPNLYGEAGNDTLYTNSNSFTVAYGGDGNDIIYSHGETYGEGGDDRIFLSGSYYPGMVNGGDGNDEIHASSFGNVISGGAGADRVYGGQRADELYGEAGKDRIEGRGGDDVISGGDGDDLLKGEDGDDRINGGAGRDRLFGGDGMDKLRGGAGNDRLFGGDGDDLLGFDNFVGYGDAGADYMEGGAGWDGYAVDDLNDVIVETADGGFDDVHLLINYFVLPDNVEVVHVDAAIGARVVGNSLDNLLFGSDGDDELFGGDGNDYLSEGHGPEPGPIGNDVLDGGAGIDEVSYRNAGAGVIVSLLIEGQQDTGGGGLDTLVDIEGLYGSVFADVLRGDSGDNMLDGDAGADLMIGGKGNDVYILEDSGDEVREHANHGIDTIWTLASFSLAGLFIENLFSVGQGSDTLIGNQFANELSGGRGADTMEGGAGNDAYFVDNEADQVVETDAAHGVDRVNSSINYTLGEHLENLTLTRTAAIDGTGNDLDNVLTGNVAANLLDGGVGADTMRGGGGDDRYVVDNVRDKAVEASADDGIDSVSSSVSFALGSHVDNLTLDGSAAIDGTGNNSANILNGNGAANTLKGVGGNDVIDGGDGNDEIVGGAGNDDLTGGAGADRFRFASAPDEATDRDVIRDFAAADDTILLDRRVFTAIGGGTLDAEAFRAGTVAAEDDDRILYDAVTGHIRYDADGVGGTSAILFATVDPGTPLTHLDFVGSS